MTGNKSILIAIDNGIIALDLKKQLNASGYNVEISNPGNKEKLKEVLSRGFQLVILEKSVRVNGLEYDAELAQNYKLPAIYLSTDTDNGKYSSSGFRILTMPFNENELTEIVKIVLEEGG